MSHCEYPCPQGLQALHVKTDEGEEKLLAQGCTFERTLQVDEHGTSQVWTERIHLVRMESLRQRQLAGLQARLQQATAHLLALTPPPGRGQRQIQTEAALIAAATAILKRHDVEGLLTYTFEPQEKRQLKYVGRGRGSASRPQQEQVTVRYQVTAVHRVEDALNAHQQSLGWRAYVTNAPAAHLTWEQAVLAYRSASPIC